MIRVRNLTHGYDRGALFHDLSCEFEPQSKVGITGANGRGKTTLLLLLSGFLKPQAGQIFLADTPAARVPRSNIGLSLVEAMHYPPLTGWQNLEYSAKLFGCSVDHDAIAQSVPQLPLSARVETYSSGQKAVLSILQATLHKPRYLFLDEPFAHLDATHSEWVRDLTFNYPGLVCLSAQTDAEIASITHTQLRVDA